MSLEEKANFSANAIEGITVASQRRIANKVLAKIESLKAKNMELREKIEALQAKNTRYQAMRRELLNALLPSPIFTFDYISHPPINLGE